jgi:hypothetical protein
MAAAAMTVEGTTALPVVTTLTSTRPGAVRGGTSTGGLGIEGDITVCLKLMWLYRIQRHRVNKRKMSVPVPLQKTRDISVPSPSATASSSSFINWIYLFLFLFLFLNLIYLDRR